MLLTHFVNAQTATDHLKWWKNDKFGLFIHFGIYSIGHYKNMPQKGNEHFMFFEKIPLASYTKLADSLSLENYNPDFWVKTAKEAGMKYIVITAKHHDGFAMYNSPSNDFNIVKKSSYGKDPMTELSKACKKYGIKLCFYYSLGRDWESPYSYWNQTGSKADNNWDYPDVAKKDNQRYIDEKVKPQLKELLTQYGPIGVIWFDTPEGITPKQSADLRQFIKKIQPNCIINSRIGNDYGDFEVQEQKILTETELKPWESCITISGKWGYSKFDKNWKSPELLIRQLIEIVAKGGNFLLNVTPKADGSLSQETISRLSSIGKWMEVNNEAIYGVTPYKVLNEGAISEKGRDDAMGKSDNDFTSKNIKPDIYYSKKGNIIYAYARSWTKKEINMTSLRKGMKNIKNIRLLGTNTAIKWKHTDFGLEIEMPNHLPSVEEIYVFKITTQ